MRGIYIMDNIFMADRKPIQFEEYMMRTAGEIWERNYRFSYIVYWNILSRKN